MMGKIIGIVGGVGPYAGLDLASKIMHQTIASIDQEHLPVALLSYSEIITSRAAFLRGEEKDNPALGISVVLRQLEQIGASVVGIPCNTVHAPQVFDQIRTDLVARNSSLCLLHMIEETAQFLRAQYPDLARVGVLSTIGTQRACIYPLLLEDDNITVLTPCEGTQHERVTPAIYDRDYGIKAQSNPVSERARGDLLAAAAELVDAGSEAIILGCTEIPLALPENKIGSTPLVDPTLIMARALIRAVAPHQLRPLLCNASY